MKPILLAALLLAPLAAAPLSARAETNIRVGWCARTVSSAAAPFAIATKMGWFAKEGLSEGSDVQLHLCGSCAFK